MPIMFIQHSWLKRINFPEKQNRNLSALKAKPNYKLMNL